MKTGLERIGLILLCLIAAIIFAVVKTWPAPKVSGEEGVADARVLRYESCHDAAGLPVDCSTQNTIPCYGGADYDIFMQQQASVKNMTPVLTADLDSGEKLVMFRSHDSARFESIVTGPDKNGATEACIVAAGKNINWRGPAAPVPDAFAPAE